MSVQIMTQMNVTAMPFVQTLKDHISAGVLKGSREMEENV